jgi:hypothetical protein
MAAQNQEKCEGCGRLVSQLRPIESGQRICLSCWQELHPQAPEQPEDGGNPDDLRDSGVSHFFTKAVEVSERNPDGVGRQVIIVLLSPSEPLRLAHEPANPHDPNAIAVLNAAGERIGYLDSELAARIVERTRLGCQYHAFVKEVTTGEAQAAVGVNLLIIEAKPGVPYDKVRTYIGDTNLKAAWGDKANPNWRLGQRADPESP